MRRTGSPSYEEFNVVRRTVVPLSVHGSGTLPPRDGSLWLPLTAFAILKFSPLPYDGLPSPSLQSAAAHVA